MTDADEWMERCQCGHLRKQHADRDNRLELVPLSKTEADFEGDERRFGTTVPGGGACTIAGCDCTRFTDARS
jgi:hypothetical protein